MSENLPNLVNLANKMDNAISTSFSRLLSWIPGLNKFSSKEAASLLAYGCIAATIIRLFWASVGSLEDCSIAFKCQEFLSAWASFTLMNRVAEGTGLESAGSIGVYARLVLVGSMLLDLHRFGESLTQFYTAGWHDFNVGDLNVVLILTIAPILTVASLYLVDANDQPSNKKNGKTLSQRFISILLETFPFRDLSSSRWGGGKHLVS
jgi:hypothetical protein